MSGLKRQTKNRLILTIKRFLTGASGDTELFEKHSNINGFWLSDNKISCL